MSAGLSLPTCTVDINYEDEQTKIASFLSGCKQSQTEREAAYARARQEVLAERKTEREDRRLREDRMEDEDEDDEDGMEDIATLETIKQRAGTGMKYLDLLVRSFLLL